MTLALARQVVRRAARSAIDPARSSFGDAFVDDAIRWAGSRFCDETKVVLTVSDIALTGDDKDVSFSAVTAFRPERIYRARPLNDKVTITITGAITVTGGTFTIIYTDTNGTAVESTAIPYNATTGDIQTRLTDLSNVPSATYITVGGVAGAWIVTINVDLEDFGSYALGSNDLTYNGDPATNGVAITRLAEACEDIAEVDLSVIQNERRRCGDQTSTPKLLGFSTQTAAEVYPTPSANGTLRVWHWTPLTAFTSGSLGAYSSGTTYYQGDVVSSSSVAYVCILTGSGRTPVSSPTYWLSLGTTTAVPVADPTSATLNIPDDLIDRVLTGAAGKLLEASADKGDLAASQALLTQFEKFITDSAGRGSVSGKSSGRSSLGR